MTSNSGLSLRKPAALLISAGILAMLIAGCASNKYTPARPAGIELGSTVVDIGEGWLRAPSSEMPEERRTSRTYSRESLDRDRLMLIPSIRDGQAIFRDSSGSGSLPSFGTGMTHEQIATLVAESIQQALWDRSATVTASNAREHGFLGTPGFQFELAVDMPSGPDHKGIAGGFVHDDRLYVNVFVAEAPGHFNEHEDAARHVIETATVRLPTIRMN